MFWDGKLPKPVVEAWNAGSLDGMLKHLQGDDLSFILQNAPPEFYLWTIKQKYGSDFDGMKKDSDWLVRLTGYAAAPDIEGMKKDENDYVRLTGYAAAPDIEGMKKNSEGYVRMAGYVMDPDFDIRKMQRPQIALAA